MTLPHELLERLADAAVDERLADALYTIVPTPIGELTVAQGPRGVCRVGFEGEGYDAVLAEVADVMGPRLLRSAEHTKAVTEALDAYFAGEFVDFKLPVDLSLMRSDFRRRVLQRLRKVRGGKVTTYGSLAEAIGAPRAARAVGSACATNPVPIIVPCHRVVPSSGGLGNYGGGVERKRWLLEFEGAL